MYMYINMCVYIIYIYMFINICIYIYIHGMDNTTYADLVLSVSVILFLPCHRHQVAARSMALCR